MKRMAVITALVLATLLVVILLWQLRSVLWLFILSLAVAATVRPLIERLVARKVPTGVALLAVYVLGIAVLVGFVALISQSLAQEIQRLVNDFTISYETILTAWPHGSTVEQTIVAQLPASNDLLTQLTGSRGLALAQTALGFTLSVVDLVSQVLLILVLSLYWTTDRVRFERLWLSLLQTTDRIRARNIWRSVDVGLGAYIRSEFVQSVVAVMIFSVGYSILGVRYPVLLALIAAVLWFIPLVGGVLVFLVALGVGLLSGPLVAIGVVALTLVVLAALELIVEPRLFNRKRYNPILILVVMVAMTDAFGVFGLILGPTLAVALQICLTEITTQVMPVAASTMTQSDIVRVEPQVSSIRERLATVRQMLSQMNEPSPRLLNMTERLESLVKELDHL